MMKKKEIIVIIIYSIIIIISIILSYLLIDRSKNKLGEEEKNIYEALLIDKNNFKNPESIKVIYVKYCNNQYSIVGITANNSYGATSSETYFKNKNVFSTDNNAIKTVSEECFKIETESYNKVKVLSKTALTRINNKLNRGTKWKNILYILSLQS